VLREKGARVLFGVDATRLEKTSALKGKVFDRIVWNFPHVGKGITDQDRNILSNQILILGFLRSAARYLVRGPTPQLQPSRKRNRHSSDDDDECTDGDNDQAIDGRARGTILITLRNVPPYTEWDVPKLAKRPPPPPRSSADMQNPHYNLFRSFVFNRSDWKGYEHRMTKGERAHGEGKTGEGGEDRTWEFYLT
jgi:25S rRNA (uracil2634-N3)-methyltransferase